MELQERLALLVDSGQIRPEAAAAAERLLAGVTGYLGRPVEAETGAMMVTHVAMAVERLLAGEPLPDVSEVVMAEVSAYPDTWAAAANLFEVALRAEATTAGIGRVPDSEIAYLTLHLQTLQVCDTPKA